jgi:adenylosuccinate synthase
MKTLIVGLQYGDEGKGRVSAFLGKDCDWFVRYNGGPNAGHTVYHNGKKHKLHHLPAGAVMGKKVALDTGMVINPTTFLKECDAAGVNPEELYISENVHIIQDRHVEADVNGSGVGSTKRGIAYVYGDRALRRGTRFGDCPILCKLYKGLPPISSNESAIYEGAQAIMIDVDYGHYPYVTSSSVFPSMIHNINKRVGVMKGYTTRVGDGPPNFSLVPELVERGSEFGTTTGRPRKCYWLIVDEVKYALSLLQPDEIVVTKLDVMKDMDIKVWNNNKEVTIGNLDSYKNYLLEMFPQIKYFSESPDGDLIKV